MKKKVKIGLTIVLLGVLFIPLKRDIFNFIEERPLAGSYSQINEPIFSLDGWFSSSFQEEYEIYFNTNFGFRSSFVRLHNQIQYSLFNKTAAKDVEIGKDNYLFEGGYIRDYMGYSFIGKDKIVERLKKIQKIQEELKKDSINLFIAFAPGKASYYPEYFPIEYDTSKRTLSNYLCYIQKCDELKIDYIDFNSFFIKHKTKSKDPLFPKGGIHWGEYGVALSLDTLSRYIEKKRKVKMPVFEIEDVVYYDTLQKPDEDISDAMNLIIDLDFYKMPTPKYIFKKNKDVVKPRLLIIGDSYGYGFTNSPITSKLFSTIEYWYYNVEIKSSDENREKKVADIIVKEELHKFDVIILLSSESNLLHFDFNFANSYENGDDFQIENEIQKVITNIKKSQLWYGKVKTQAKEMNITIDKSLRENAIFVIEKRKEPK
jgi:SGNH hydrolase-like domain, acetyltransferase AlgX